MCTWVWPLASVSRSLIQIALLFLTVAGGINLYTLTSFILLIVALAGLIANLWLYRKETRVASRSETAPGVSR